ncbi:glycosyltransferase family 2 protein [Pendulispora albinea]|uniref:Glycosyltransferase n=1 Tax=Pendulispora albinea TaxID=2741071 RepID=A0ABZ2LUE8_9BACT
MIQQKSVDGGLTIVIPTYNMATFLPGLWQSLARSGITEIADEVLFVNDGSTDDTKDALARLAGSADPPTDKVKVLNLPSNVGRFRARLAGARSAKSPRILFLDTRLDLPNDLGSSVARVAREYPAVVGTVDIDVSRNVYCLYWDRSHRFIFRRHYAAAVRPITLRPDNFDQYLKGTTVFLCSKQHFLDVCERLDSQIVLNDDTLLMRSMVDSTPIVISPDVRVGWVPRETTWAFLARLWERGPSFVEYHVFDRRSKFFYVVMLALVALVLLALLLAVRPIVGLEIIFGCVLAVALSTSLFAKSPAEFVKLLPLHVAVVFVFGTGVLRGLAVNSVRAIRGTLPHSKSDEELRK